MYLHRSCLKLSTTIPRQRRRERDEKAMNHLNNERECKDKDKSGCNWKFFALAQSKSINFYQHFCYGVSNENVDGEKNNATSAWK